MKKINFQINVPVLVFREGKHFVAYTSVLDLSTAGSTYSEVKKRFVEAVGIFFEETSKAGTLEQVLRELGWRRIKKQWSPPPLISHEPENIKLALAV